MRRAQRIFHAQCIKAFIRNNALDVQRQFEENVKAFLAAVEAIVLPEEIDEEKEEELSKLVATAMEAYEAMSAEDLEREDVKAALQLLDEAVKALGSISTLDETVPVAKIGDAKYATLDEAVAAAGDGAFDFNADQCGVKRWGERV